MSSGPNKTVYAIRNRASALLDRFYFGGDRTAAETKADAIRTAIKSSGCKGFTVRVSSYKIGPRDKPSRNWMVRVYLKGDATDEQVQRVVQS